MKYIMSQVDHTARKVSWQSARTLQTFVKIKHTPSLGGTDPIEAMFKRLEISSENNIMLKQKLPGSINQCHFNILN